ncbi:MAG: TraB/GumN family protein [Pseudomonadota bacterium]
MFRSIAPRSAARSAPRIAGPIPGVAAAWLAALVAGLLPLAPARAELAEPALSAPTPGAVAREAAAAAPPPGVALWRVTDEDSVLWLLGSVHLLDPELEWRRPAIDRAIAGAERAYFETPTDLAAQAQAVFLIARLGAQPPGRSLNDQLSDDGKAALENAALELGFDLAQMDRQRPWLAMLQIVTLSFRKMGLDVEAGVENVILPELLRAKKEIRYLETIEQQLRFLADLPEPTQLNALELTLAQRDEEAAQLDALIAAWRNGDVDALEEINAQSYEDAPALSEVLLTRRNRAWIDPLLKELAGSGETLVVVGAAHLVGEDGVPALLAASPRGADLVIERR